MRISFLGLFCCFILMLSSGVPVTAGPTDPVTIPDAVLRSRIEDALNKAAGATITEADMATLTRLRADQQHDIRELTGLEYAVNLKELVFLRSIPQTRAQLFARPFWRTADLAPLKKLTKLEWLSFQGVVIFDMTPIANLTNLKALTFNYTYGITEIPDLSNLTELLHLRLLRNEITDISGVSGLTKLQQLDLGVNQNLSDITPLTQLRNLEILRLDRTRVTRESLSAVLPFMSPDIDQMPSTDFPLIQITSGEFGISGTNISDLSVLDNFPNVFLHALYLQFMGSISQKTYFFHLKDLTPLVELMNKPKLINSKTDVFLQHNYGLDYPSFYEEIPALIAGSKSVRYVENPNPQLEREFPKGGSYEGLPGSPVTFKVRAVNTNPDFPASLLRLTPHGTGENRQFAEVPVTWKVTAPDGTVTEQKVPTGDDGLSSFTFTLGNDGETHTVEAIVPAKTNPQANLSHGELKVEFTATAVAPPVIQLTLYCEGTTQTNLQWIAEVSGTLPEAYVAYHKKSVSRDWIEAGSIRRGARQFSFIHSELQPSTSYDLQLFALKNGRRFGSGSNVLTARTLSPGESRPCPPSVAPPVVQPPADPPEETPEETPEAPQPPVQPPVGPPSDEPQPPVVPPSDEPQPPVEPPGQPRVGLLVQTAVQPPEDPSVEPPVETPGGASVGGGGSGGGGGLGTYPLTLLGTQSFIFNEIGNSWNDTNDWIELKNVCDTPLDLSEWQVRLIRTEPLELGGQIETDVISFPDFLLPAEAVLLVASTDPSRTPLANGLDIATGGRQKGAQHPYFVAPDLKLPSRPYLLILQRAGVANGRSTPTLIDVAGSLFFEVLPDGSESYFDPDVSEFTASIAPLTDAGVSERQRLDVPGYLAVAWRPSGYRGGIGYDRGVEPSVSLGSPGYRRDASAALPGLYRLAFNEIRNAANDTDDWIELKNVCGEEVRLRDWHISRVLNTGSPVDEEDVIVSFPDWTLPMGGVLLITNTDPKETVLADGLNIATGGRQRGAQHPYLVAPALKLPERPYLLILHEVPAYDERSVEDVAGNYALTTLPDGTEIHPHAYLSHRGEPLAPLTHFGAWQRRNPLEVPGYLASAWMSSGYHAHIGYDRYAPASVCLGTPGYRHDASPVMPETQRLVFNKIHNDGNDPENYIDWIELKNISDTGVRLRDWDISIVASAGENADEDVSLLRFPDWTLPAGGVLLILRSDPGQVIFNGRDIATDAHEMDAQEIDAQEIETPDIETQRAYFVAPDLRLPETPYLLILRHARGKNGTPEAIEDVAGDYFRSLNNTGVWPLTHTLSPSLPAAPLSEAGTWQRRDARQHGYFATAWTVIESPLYAYPRDAFAALPVAQRLAFNKIRNALNDTDDYIELKNLSDTDVQLKDWTLSRITSVGTHPDEDLDIVWFPDWTLPSGGVLLITNTEPDETLLVDGLNITPAASQRRGAQHPYLVAPDLRLPETPYLLILRHARGENGTPDAIEDMVGNYFRSLRNTENWPQAYLPHPSAPAAPLSETGTWQRRDARQRGYLATAWTRSTSPPGVSDTPLKMQGTHALFGADALGAGVFNPTLPDEVRISELMSETQGPLGALPEWIELYNASATPVDLQGWQLRLETRIDTRHRHATLTLHPLEIPPKQTVLLVNGKVDRHPSPLPPRRIYDLSETHADAFGPRRLSDTLLSSDGFFLQLIHPTGRVVDTCGTLDGDPRTHDLPTWTLPDRKMPEGPRVSLLRRFDGDVLAGTEASGWLPATAVAIAVRHHYGHPSDISTPGFLHLIVPGNSPTVALSISELLFTTQMPDRDGLPQWIELYNPSLSRAVKLKDFQLIVETRHAGKHQHLLIDLEAIDVLPNQTVLLITRRGRHSKHFPANRVYNFPQRHPRAFRSEEGWQHLLSRDGFLIQLADATGNIVDTVGNLDGYRFTEDPPTWTLPPGETLEGARASIRRLYEKRGVPLDGRYREGWVSTAAAPPAILTYYGHASDVGNPGYRKGGPLPVVLSRFSAVRNTDTVEVSWTTQAALENAGFHLYRSTQRNSGFVRVNPKMIQGAGTTAERQTYTYIDKPPKNNRVYYYQLQEISYSGQASVLATARLKGYLSADGKHLTTLGWVKTDKRSQQ